MANKKTEQTPIAPKDGSADWRAMVASAEEKPELFPKLKFGDDKLATVQVDILFDESEPRLIEYESPFSGDMEKALVMNVRVLSGPESGSMRALFMQANDEHGLTRGVLNVAKKAGGDLKGVAARIETYTYKHKKYGPTRGYNVYGIDAPASPAP